MARLIRLLRALANEIQSIQIVDAAMALAAQSFLALFPLVIVVYAFAPPELASATLETFRLRFGLGGGSQDAMTDLLSARNALRSGISVVGVLLIVASATAFTRALQRIYERAWALPKLGVRGAAWRWLAWLAGMLVYLIVIGFAVRLAGAGAREGGLLGLGAFFLWWWSPWLLLGGRVRWRALLPTALTTTVATAVLGAVSGIVMPRMIGSNESQYGPIGVVFAVEGWLVVVGGALVVCAALGAVLVKMDTPLGRLSRGSTDPEAWRRLKKAAAPAAPPATAAFPVTGG
jgi:membrane protein